MKTIAQVKLTNPQDLADVKRGQMEERMVRQVSQKFSVDRSACMLHLNETIQEILQLPLLGMKKSTTATGQGMELPMVGPVLVTVGDRFTHCDALILPGDAEPLLGAIPLEGMDLVVHPARQELTGNPAHGGEWVFTLK